LANSADNDVQRLDSATDTMPPTVAASAQTGSPILKISMTVGDAQGAVVK
jgi:hypothetical protein